MAKVQLVDQWGNPISRDSLRREVAQAGITGVRNPHAGYPADGLNPQRLAVILRQAAESDPLNYFELAELIEERDLHYAGVLGTRKRSVAQIDITVEAASDAAEHEAHAEHLRQWLKRDCLQEELFDVLDAIGKGVSFTEIIWDFSEGQAMPERLEWRDQRFFTFDRNDWATPMLRDGIANIPLPGYKFIYGRIKAKSGLPIRSGIARMAAWAWMFKAFTQRDWAIFTATYGQPIRVGKYGPNASQDERDTLMRAVANIAGDCAAIMPDSMSMEFVEAKNVSGTTDHYERRSNWFDMQISKGVLGQTTTTDAVSGGHAVSQEHRQVQEDIERADAKALSAILNRDLGRPIIDLNFGPQKLYPRIVIARPEEEDLKMLLDAAERLVPMGVRVSKKKMATKFSLEEPEDEDDVLSAPAARAAAADPAAAADKEGEKPKDQAKDKAKLFASFAPKRAAARKPDQVDQLVELAGGNLDQATTFIIEQIRAAADEAPSLEALQGQLLAMLPGLSEERLAEAMGEALVLAGLSGRLKADADPTP